MMQGCLVMTPILGSSSPREPSFSDAVAYWKMDDIPFLDSTDNFIDFPGVLGTQQIHPLFPERLIHGYATGTITVLDNLLHIVGDVTIHALMASSSPSGRFDIQCYSTGDTDCLYGFGISGGNFRIWDKSLPGGVQFPFRNANVIQAPYNGSVFSVFATRTGPLWRLYGQGGLAGEVIVNAAPNVAIGNEVLAISSTSVVHSYSHAAVWDRALSASEIAAHYKSMFGR